MRSLRIHAKRLLRGFFLMLGLLAIVLTWNTWRLESRQIRVQPQPAMKLDEQALISRFQAAIRIPSISKPLAKLTAEDPIYQFRDFLSETFPELHEDPWICRTGRVFGDDAIASVLLEWPGENPDLDGILLMSHFDVVPVESSSKAVWRHPPFDGTQDDEFVWGRGTLDCKQGVMAILEAMQRLVEDGFRPERTIYVALGHDEELGGQDGNLKMADWMRRNGRRLHMVLDEGGCIYKDFPGMNRPTALVGIAEKGVLNILLSVDVAAQEVGHASMPPPQTAVGIIATAVAKLQSQPFPVRIEGGLKDTLTYLGPEMPSIVSRVAMANLWLFQPLVTRQLAAKPSGNALIRTTLAPTVIQGGIEYNILPHHAEAMLNLRLLPGDSVDEAVDYVRQVINDSRVQITPQEHPKPASSMTDPQSDAFLKLQKTLGEIYPEAVVAPFVLVGSTDSVHYSAICDHILRIIPHRISERDTQRFHGIDERIAKQDYIDLVRFYHRLVHNTAGPTTAPE